MEISAVAWSIANDEFVRRWERFMALGESREAHEDIFEKLSDAGVFELSTSEVPCSREDSLSNARS